MKKGNERNPKQLGGERDGKSYMMGFDSATSSFLALLINKSKKTEKGKIKNKSFQRRS